MLQLKSEAAGLTGAEGELVDALAQRVLDLEKAEVHLSPMGCAHVFWACAALRVRIYPRLSHQSYVLSGFRYKAS